MAQYGKSDDSKSACRFRDRSIVGTDMTSMVDVTFLLLIFFMVTASFTLNRAIAMPSNRSELPSPEKVDQSRIEAVSLNIDSLGGFLLVTPAGQQELLGKQSLVTALKDARSASVDARLEISVDAAARLQALVDGIDAGTIAGFPAISVIQSEHEDAR